MYDNNLVIFTNKNMSEYYPANKDELDETPIHWYGNKDSLDNSDVSDKTQEILSNE